jgi:hypothetical protein
MSPRDHGGGRAMSPLIGEYISIIRQMRLEDAMELAEAGIPWRAITQVCPAPARISFDGSGGRFQIDPTGRWAWVFPACAVDESSPYLIEDPDPDAVIAEGDVVDLIAVDPDTPECWSLRTGAAVVLGAVEDQIFLPHPVPVWRTPVAWLRAECHGLVLLTDDPSEAGRILRQIDAIIPEDAAHGVQLQRWLTTPLRVSTRIITEGLAA